MNRMRLWLAGLALGMATTAALGQASAPAQVVFTYHGTFPDAVRVADVCYVSPAMLSKWGWQTQKDGAFYDVEADGRRLRLEAKSIGNRTLVSLNEAGRLLGADLKWDDKGETLFFRGSVRNVESTGQGLRVDSTVSALPRAFRLSNPDRLVIDIQGAVMEPRLLTNLPTGWRVGQFKDDVVRVVIEHPSMSQQPIPTLTPSRKFEIDLPMYGAPPPTIRPPLVDEHGHEGDESVQDPGMGSDVILPDSEVTVSTPRVSTKGDRAVALLLPYVGVLPAGPSAKFLGPEMVEVVVPGAAPATTEEVDLGGQNLVTNASIAPDGKGNAVITLTLSRPLVFELGTAEGLVTLDLRVPVQADGKLAGKVIVVDAGHGGTDSGARAGGVNEKDLNLAIAKKLAKSLSDSGASVIMTRTTDVLIPLKERAEIANRSDAAFFISVHINSNTVANSRSGGMTFYHQQNQTGMLLAECIQKQIAKVSGLPTLGAWSDSRIYRSGFAVLRHSTMPAVLIEMGFINHSRDRARMTTEEFKTNVAKAITQGLKVFLGDGKK